METGIKVTKDNSVLQRNLLTVTFNLATDLTVPGTLVTSYRYRYKYTNVLLGTEDTPFKYDENNTEFSSYYSLNPYAGLVIDSNNKTGSFTVTIPDFSYDSVLWIEIEPYDDYTRAFISNYHTSAGPFVAFVNSTPEIYCSDVRWTGKTSLNLEWGIQQAGILYPMEPTYGEEAWTSYVNTLKSVTAERTLTPTVVLTNRVTKEQFTQALTPLSLSEWYPHLMPTVTIDKDWLASDKDWDIQMYVQISEVAGPIDFDFIADSKSKYYSNQVLLKSVVAAFQIKRRGIKAHMLEDDPTLGTFSTGAGMFNHGEEVGVDVSEGAPKLDKSKGHSIALYDTRADGDHVSNKPSIGFMNDRHQALGYLRYDPSKGDRGALVSNLPIIGNNQEVDDDPSVNYTMSIGLVLGNGEIKTISFNGELS